MNDLEIKKILEKRDAAKENPFEYSALTAKIKYDQNSRSNHFKLLLTSVLSITLIVFYNVKNLEKIKASKFAETKIELVNYMAEDDYFEDGYTNSDDEGDEALIYGDEI